VFDGLDKRRSIARSTAWGYIYACFVGLRSIL